MVLAKKTKQNKKQENQWIRIEDPDINPCIYSQLFFYKEAQNTEWRKYNLFSKCCCENWISICRRLKLYPCLSPCTKINSKWITDLYIWPETLKQFQEAVGNTLDHIVIGNNFLNRTQKAQHLRERMNKCNYIKLKSFCTATQQRKQSPDSRDSPQNGRKSLPGTHPTRD
jgi:hypothetical protein